MIYFQSKYLAEKCNINLAKWKRWAREFLPPDPLGGLRSGYARQFSHKDAFRVYLAGYLVSALKFSVPETKKILVDLDAWLKKQGLFALPNNKKGRPVTVFYHIFIFQPDEGHFVYAIKSTNQASPFECNRHQTEQGDTTIIGPPEFCFDPNALFGARVLLITGLYHAFLDLIHG